MSIKQTVTKFICLGVNFMIDYIKCFGSSVSTGNLALVIQNHEHLDENAKQLFAHKTNQTCVFADLNKQFLELDFYYPNKRSMLCIHGAIAAGYIYFKNNLLATVVNVKTKFSNKSFTLSKQANGIFVVINTENVNTPNIDKSVVAQMLNVNEINIINEPVVYSVGSPKLLVEVDSITTLNKLMPSLTDINLWGAKNNINGLYVFYKITENEYVGRNFNHDINAIEDSATGVAAGALSSMFAKSITVYQGGNLNNLCKMYAYYNKTNISIGGFVYNIIPFAH
jgi:PhzF family phenazine biosynthesis protein